MWGKWNQRFIISGIVQVPDVVIYNVYLEIFIIVEFWHFDPSLICQLWTKQVYTLKVFLVGSIVFCLHRKWNFPDIQ